MQDNTSPEGRLLCLIRGDHEKLSRSQEEIVKDIELSQSKEAIQKSFSLSEKFSLNLINQILLAIFLISGVYLAADFLINNSDKIGKRISSFREAKNGNLIIQAKADTSLKPFSYYAEPLKSRSLFAGPGTKTNQGEPTASFLEMVAKLKLQGIVFSGSNPQAIIKDTNTQQVYFLSPGESIGEIELKKVLQGKVKLGYYGQEAELSL